LIDAEKCVGIALTLQNLRDRWPYQKWNVNDAIEVYMKGEVFHPAEKELTTDTLYANWEGEFARYAQDQSGVPLLVQNQSRLIWIPEGASELTIVMNYDMFSIEERTVGDLTFVVDYGYDGTFDYEHPFLGSRLSGVKEATLSIDGSITGQYWAVGVYGRGFKVLRPLQDREFMELRIEYDIGVSLKLQVPVDEPLTVSSPTPNSMVSTWRAGEPSGEYSGGSILLKGTMYDVSRMSPLEEDEGGEGEEGLPWSVLFILILLTIAAVAVYLWYRKRGGTVK
jgi:hypothetical protein